MQQAVDATRGLPAKNMLEHREDAEVNGLLALSLARLGRLDEARAMAAASLAFQRELHGRGLDDEMHKRDLAVALVASAWSEPGRAKGLLAEARNVLGSMPAEALGLRSSRWVADLISQAGRELR